MVLVVLMCASLFVCEGGLLVVDQQMDTHG